MKSTVFMVLLILVFTAEGCLGSRSQDKEQGSSSVIDKDSILLEAKQNGLIMDDEQVLAMSLIAPQQDAGKQEVENAQIYLEAQTRDWKAAALADVTGGGGYGIAHAVMENDLFTLVAQMGNLPEPAQGYYYEGWLVRRDALLEVLSIGKVQIVEDGFINVYRSQTDLSDFSFYVLTLEKDDGNSSAGEHILEGTFK